MLVTIYKKSIVIFIAFFICFAVLLKHGVELTGQFNDMAVIVDINSASDDLHEEEVDDSQAMLFEANDDFILTLLANLTSHMNFSPFFLAHTNYCMPTQSNLLRPPSYYLS